MRSRDGRSSSVRSLVQSPFAITLVAAVAAFLLGAGLTAALLRTAPTGSGLADGEPTSDVAAGAPADASSSGSRAVSTAAREAGRIGSGADAAGEPLGPPGPPPHLRIESGSLEYGESLHTTLTNRGISPSTVHRVARELRPYFDFRYAQPGDRYRISLLRDGTLIEFDYQVSPDQGYRVYRMGDGYVAERREEPLERRQTRLAGVVTTSLYDSVQALGESPQLARDFADIFAWDLDFSREVRPGDEFRVLYERLYRREGGQEVYVKPGVILAAQYRGAAGVHTAIHFETEAGRSGYYRPDGSSVERQFLRAPLRYSRISSKYTHSRYHPILKVRRPHLGIDYAAPSGTPVWAVAEGVVTFAGWSGGFGKLVKVRHSNGLISYYGHLQRFAKGMKVGKPVSQKEVIGYVGSTGLSTGPHVDFRVRNGDHYVNPASVRTPPADPVPMERLSDFLAVRDAHLAELDPTPLATVGEAL